MVVNLEMWKRRIERVPAKLKPVMQAALEEAADTMVAEIKRNAPVGDGIEERAGELRDSIRWEPSRKRELSVVIIADAKDEKGHGYAPHVEHGHRTPSGEHVQRQPFFFPTYRAHKKRVRNKMRGKVRKAFKTL